MKWYSYELVIKKTEVAPDEKVADGHRTLNGLLAQNTIKIIMYTSWCRLSTEWFSVFFDMLHLYGDFKAGNYHAI